MTGTKAFIVGVDGLDYDVVRALGPTVLPHLSALMHNSRPHLSTFPPDSVPSWTSMLGGEPPWKHGQLHSKNYILDDPEASGEATLNNLGQSAFWAALPAEASLAVINPFMAYPAFAPSSIGAMVSGPPFTEGGATVADTSGLLIGEPPERMGGFTSIPSQRDLEVFANETRDIAETQYRYTLTQLESGRFDAIFHTTLTIDRIEHFAWRHFDAEDPLHPGPRLSWLIPAAYSQLDRFLGTAKSLLPKDAKIAVFSDHGHGPRASVGVNLNEIFRRAGLYRIHGSPTRTAIEAAKTAAMSYAPSLRLENVAIALAKRVPGKSSLKSGLVAGKPARNSVSVPHLAGSNPYGGVSLPEGQSTEARVVEILQSLEHEGQKVLKWVERFEVFSGSEPTGGFPDLVFEFHPRFAPTWNLYGPQFADILTRRRLSGGHTRRAVFATNEPSLPSPADSIGVYHALRQLIGSL